MAGTLITVAATGAETAKADVPALPTTLPELVATAIACEAAGAAMIHVHIRDDEHRPTLDVPRLRDTVAALREATSLIVQLSTGGSVHDSFEARLAVLDAAPDSCSLSMGSVNFGDEIFANPWGFITELYRAARDRRIVPEFELFDLGHAHALRRLLDEQGLPYGGRVHCDLVLGVPGAADATPRTLLTLVDALPAQCTSWSATGIGRGHLPILATALAAGGHARVGMEDNLVFAKGRPVRDNAELVTRAAEFATLMQRPPLSVRDARALLAIPESGVGHPAQ